jgi:tetratricopeptide (TPR) repeat protein
LRLNGSKSKIYKPPNLVVKFLSSIFFLTILVLPFYSPAQDSEEIEKIDSLIVLSKSYWAHEPGKTLKLGKEIGVRSEVINYEKGKTDAIYVSAVALWFLEDYSKSLKKISEALLKYQLLEDEIGIAGCYNHLGMIYHQIGDDGVSLDYFFKALKISGEQNYELGGARTLQNIGVIYREQGDLDLSLEYFLKSIELLEKHESEFINGGEYANVALSYQLKKDYEPALKYYQLSFEFFQASKNEVGLTKYYEKLGELYLQMGLPDDAEKEFDLGYGLSQRLDLKEGRIENGKGLIKTWDFLGKEIKSDSLINILDKIVLHIENPRTRMNWYESLSDHYESSGDLRKSLEFHKKTTVLKDSLLGVDQKKIVNQLKAVHGLETIRKENQTLKKNLDITKKMNLGVALALIIFLGLIIMISRFYSLKENANKKLLSLNEELIFQQKETEEKAKELSEANTTISNINSHLEKIIGERTAELKKKNKKILDFAFFNSHQVRGSVARIMGLMEVFNLATEKKETKSVSELLKAQAKELDDLIRDINKLLAEEGYPEDQS